MGMLARYLPAELVLAEVSGAAAEKAAVDDMVRARVHNRVGTWNFIGVRVGVGVQEREQALTNLSMRFVRRMSNHQGTKACSRHLVLTHNLIAK